MKLSLWAITHGGRRPENQDAIALVDRVLDAEAQIVSASAILTANGTVAAVADGVGGRPEGRWAARTVLAGLIQNPIPDNTSAAISIAISDANKQITDRVSRGLGPATTLAGVSASTNRMVIFHVGDSRVSRIARSGVERLTLDHRSRTDSRSITRFLGGSLAHAVASLKEVEVQSGDMFLVSTDGFHGFLRDSDLLLFQDIEPARAIAMLIDMALENGSNDNLSAIFCRFE